MYDTPSNLLIRYERSFYFFPQRRIVQSILLSPLFMVLLYLSTIHYAQSENLSTRPIRHLPRTTCRGFEWADVTCAALVPVQGGKVTSVRSQNT